MEGPVRNGRRRVGSATAAAPSRPFLSARWVDLVLASWPVDARLLEPLVPRGVELDPWAGTAWASVVAFRFVDTRVCGVPVPGHRTFEEVNLRFYVRRRARDGELRRGVVFVRELVPRPAIVAVARGLYGEPYALARMGHRLSHAPGRREVEYWWEIAGSRHRCAVTLEGVPEASAVGSEAEFFTEHYWGYTDRGGGRTSEYRVDHPRWRVWTDPPHELALEPRALYGEELGGALAGRPPSLVVAEGSDVRVAWGQGLRP